MVGFHDGVGDCGDPFEEVLTVGGCGAGERFDEDDAGVGGLVAGVEAPDAEGHFGARLGV